MNYREYSGQYASADIRSGPAYSYRIYVPNIFSEAELAVLVTHDGLNEAEAEGMARLYEEKRSSAVRYCWINARYYASLNAGRRAERYEV